MSFCYFTKSYFLILYLNNMESKSNQQNSLDKLKKDKIRRIMMTVAAGVAISTSILDESEARGGRGGFQAPVQRFYSPPPQRYFAPPPQQRFVPPPQPRFVPQQPRFVPQPQQRFVPPQQPRFIAPPAQRYFNPPQQPRFVPPSPPLQPRFVPQAPSKPEFVPQLTPHQRFAPNFKDEQVLPKSGQKQVYPQPLPNFFSKPKPEPAPVPLNERQREFLRQGNPAVTPGVPNSTPQTIPNKITQQRPRFEERKALPVQPKPEQKQVQPVPHVKQEQPKTLMDKQIESLEKENRAKAEQQTQVLTDKQKEFLKQNRTSVLPNTANSTLQQQKPLTKEELQIVFSATKDGVKNSPVFIGGVSYELANQQLAGLLTPYLKSKGIDTTNINNYYFKIGQQTGDKLSTAVDIGFVITGVGGVKVGAVEFVKGTNGALKIAGAVKTAEALPKILSINPGLKLGQDFGKLGKVIENAPGKITQINEHAFEKANEILIRNVIANPSARLVQSDGRILYLNKDGLAVLDKEGKVITAWSKDYFRPYILDVINSLK